MARPTAQIAPGLRSIQITTRSSTPASSTPIRTRSAKRPAVDFRLTGQGYNRLDAATLEPAARSVLVPLRPIEHGGPRRCLRDPRARTRPWPLRDPGRPLRAEPPLTRATATPSRSTGDRPRARRRRRGRDAARPREPHARLELASEPALPGEPDCRRRDRDVPGGDAVGLEQRDVVLGLTTDDVPADDLMELVYLEPVQ